MPEIKEPITTFSDIIPDISLYICIQIQTSIESLIQQFLNGRKFLRSRLKKNINYSGKRGDSKMKRTIILLMVMFLVTSVYLFNSNEVFGSNTKKACCDIKITVLSKGGTPVSNCFVTIAGPCGDTGQTDSNGQVKLCVGDCGLLTVSTCCGGSAQFTACSTSSITINCP